MNACIVLIAIFHYIRSHCRMFLCVCFILLSACSDSQWNSPYNDTDSQRNIYYDSFSERPKHLDPVRAYSANEYVFIGQIYEPPLQYHYLKRPYTLVPLTATAVPEPHYFNARGEKIAADSPASEVARVRYRVQISPGIFYQPHPALARDKTGKYRYHALQAQDLDGIHRLSDFQHTGTRELTAADYVYQIKRMAHPGLHSPIAGLMMKYILDLAGLEARLQAVDSSGSLDLNAFDCEGVQIIDRYTFEIILQKKYPQFIYWLAMYFFSPMPWEAAIFYQQEGMHERNISLDWYPIGTGAFMLASNNPNRRMVMQRNPNFRGELYPSNGEPEDEALGLMIDKGKVMPFIDTAIYSLEKEAIPSWSKFLQGYYDTSGLVSDSFDQAIQFNLQGEVGLSEAMQEKGIQLLTATSSSIYYMGFNMQNDVVGGNSQRAILLRRAISIAVDYEEFIAIFANGRGIPAHGPLAPGIYGYIEGEQGINPYVYQLDDGLIKRRSLAEAQALMREAGYPEGRDPKTGQALLLHLDSGAAGPGSKAYFDWLRKQFAKLGVHLVIRATDYNRFQEKMLTGTAEIFQWGWNADYPDPENFFFLLYGPNIKAGKNGENAANYQNADFDRLFAQMRDMPNGAERQRIINKMVAIIRADAPWLWGYHPVSFSLHHAWYKNAKPNLMSNNNLKYKRIMPLAREQARQAWNRPVWVPIALILLLVFFLLLPACFIYLRQERASIL